MTQQERDHLEKLVNPPAIFGPDTIVLSPPLGSAAEYIAYIEAHHEDYKRLFSGGEE